MTRPRVKVLQFAATWGGGLATHVATLAQRLDRSTYDVHVLCPEEGELRRRLRLLGLPFDTIPVRSETDVWGDVRMARRVLRYLNERRFDLLHLHSTKAGFWGRIAARLAGVPVVLYTPHAYRFLRYAAGSPLWAGYVALEWLGGRLGTGVIAVGPSEGQLTRRWRLAPRAGQFVVNNGVAAVAASARDAGVRSRLGLPEGRPLVLTVGRFMRQKDPLTFVAAASTVAREHDAVAFVMVGEGELEPAARSLAIRMGFADRLHIVPRTDEMVALLLEADVFVMTSRYEGLSYAAAEAAAAGRAMVLSDVPGLRDLVDPGRTGFLVTPGDAAGFAAQIVRLLGDPELRGRVGRAGAQLMAERFGIDRMVGETESVYEALLRERRPGTGSPTPAPR